MTRVSPVDPVDFYKIKFNIWSEYGRRHGTIPPSNWWTNVRRNIWTRVQEKENTRSENKGSKVQENARSENNGRKVQEKENTWSENKGRKVQENTRNENKGNRVQEKERSENKWKRLEPHMILDPPPPLFPTQPQLPGPAVSEGVLSASPQPLYVHLPVGVTLACVTACRKSFKPTTNKRRRRQENSALLLPCSNCYKESVLYPCTCQEVVLILFNFLKPLLITHNPRSIYGV